MFRQFAVQSSRRAAARFTPTFQVPRRNMNVTREFTKDEQAAERDFINKEERSLLENLHNLQRKKSELDYSAQIKSLSNTLVQHKVEPTPALVQDLMKWRLTQQ